MIDVKGNLKVGVLSGIAVTGVVYLFNKIGIKAIDNIDQESIQELKTELKELETEYDNVLTQE